MRIVLGFISLAAFATYFCSDAARGDTIAYHFKNGKPIFYEVKVSEERPGSIHSTTNYLKYRPTAVDAKGQATLRYDWGTTVTSDEKADGMHSNLNSPPAFLFGPQPFDKNPGTEILLAADGSLVHVAGDSIALQFPDLVGPVYAAALVQLPPAGKSTWTTERDLSVYNESSHKEPGGPWGTHDVTTRVDHKCHETVTYTLGERKGTMLAIEKTCKMVSDDKVGSTPADQLTGTGQYTFDTATGVVQSCEMKYTDEINESNLHVQIPVTVSARLLPADEIATMKVEHDAEEAKKKADELAKKKAETQGEHDPSDLPAGMSKTPVAGKPFGETFVKVDNGGLTTIGFRIKTGDWHGKKVIGEIDPLYEKPDDSDKPKSDESDVVARDGYAVGGIWVNSTDAVSAVRVIFMKRTDKGVDMKTAYVGPWVGALDGPVRTRLVSNGHCVTGVCGNKFFNISALTLAYLDGDSAPTAGAGGSDPTDDPNFKGTPAAAAKK